MFLEDWLRNNARPRLRPRTFVGYEGSIDRHIEPYLGRIPLARLTPQHVQAWLGRLEEDGVSPSRRRYARVVLRAALNTAARWQLVTRNVATLVDAPRVVSKEIRPLAPEESRRLLLALDDHPLAAPFTVALACGLRVGEALGLQWGDVDLEEGILTVGRALQRFGGSAKARRPLLIERTKLLRARREELSAEDRLATDARLSVVRKQLQELKTSLHLVEPKSKKSRRSITLPAILISALKRHRVRQLEARLSAGSDWHDSAFVFTTPIGTPLDSRNVTREYKAVLAKAGLPSIRLHDLRHSCATLLLVQGVSPRVVQDTLGHSSVSLTLNTYSHVLPMLKDDAALKMDAILSPAKG